MVAHPLQTRIGYTGPLEPVLEELTRVYSFGEYRSHKVITVGYEDLNVVLETNTGKYFIKFFSLARTDQQCERYVETIVTVLEHGIHHPLLYKSDHGYIQTIVNEDSITRAIALQFIEGRTFYELQQKPTELEKEFLIREAARINKIQYHPEYVYDSWAAVNFLTEYEKAKDYLEESDKVMIQPLVKEFSKIVIDSLPHCFVHGDIIDPNVMRADDGQVYILDFSVANYYPRIIELIVLLTDILFDTLDTQQFLATVQRTIDIYRSENILTEQEIKILPTFIKVMHAMHIIAVTLINKESGVTPENSEWLKRGREGLVFTSSVFP